MVVLPDHARQRNDFRIIQLARPRIERERDAEGWLRNAPRGRLNRDRAGTPEFAVCRTILQKWKGAR